MTKSYCSETGGTHWCFYARSLFFLLVSLVVPCDIIFPRVFFSVLLRSFHCRLLCEWRLLVVQRKTRQGCPAEFSGCKSWVSWKKIIPRTCLETPGMGLVSGENTRWKINMEPKNDGLEDDFPYFPTGWKLTGSVLVFRGVSSLGNFIKKQNMRWNYD